MDDGDIRQTIANLVAEEHQLRSGEEATADPTGRLRELEEALDQCWDLLRQRDALRSAGRDPDEAKARPVSEVESYLQ